MNLHPNISPHELTDYCRLCHEYRIRSVTTDPATVVRIKNIAQNQVPEYLGIKFKAKQ